MCSHNVENVLQRLVQRKGNLLEREFASFNFRNIEDVVHDAKQAACRDVDLGQVCSLPRVWIGAQCQVRHARDRVHRRTDLVAHIGKKFRLGPVGDFRLNHCSSRGFLSLFEAGYVAIALHHCDGDGHC